jgi:hypothetical protein
MLNVLFAVVKYALVVAYSIQAIVVLIFSLSDDLPLAIVSIFHAPMLWFLMSLKIASDKRRFYMYSLCCLVLAFIMMFFRHECWYDHIVTEVIITHIYCLVGPTLLALFFALKKETPEGNPQCNRETACNAVKWDEVKV